MKNIFAIYSIQFVIYMKLEGEKEKSWFPIIPEFTIKLNSRLIPFAFYWRWDIWGFPIGVLSLESVVDEELKASIQRIMFPLFQFMFLSKSQFYVKLLQHIMYTHEIVFRRADSNHANPKQINFVLLNIINDFDSFIYYYNPYAQLLTLLIWSPATVPATLLL